MSMLLGSSRRIAATIFALAVGVLPQAPAMAQGLSDRPITIVVGASAGSGNDLIARLVGDELAKKWKQAVVIRNEPGASGRIGTAQVARAAPDGHTILLTAT